MAYEVTLLYEHLDQGMERTRTNLRNVRYMRAHDELWAAGPANLLLPPALNAYRLMKMLKAREPLIMAWLRHEDGLTWTQTALPKGSWEGLRVETANEVIDMDAHGDRIHLTPYQWALQEGQTLMRWSEECERVKGESADRRTVKVSRLYTSVFFRSAEGYDDVVRKTQMALTRDGS